MLADEVRTVEVDRVVGDSQVFVAQRRRDGAWMCVLTLARADVHAVERRVRHHDGDVWLVEDVRTSAGLSDAAGAVAGVVSAPPPRRLRWRAMARQKERS